MINERNKNIYIYIYIYKIYIYIYVYRDWVINYFTHVLVSNMLLKSSRSCTLKCSFSNKFMLCSEIFSRPCTNYSMNKCWVFIFQFVKMLQHVIRERCFRPYTPMVSRQCTPEAWCHMHAFGASGMVGWYVFEQWTAHSSYRWWLA